MTVHVTHTGAPVKRRCHDAHTGHHTEGNRTMHRPGPMVAALVLLVLPTLHSLTHAATDAVATCASPQLLGPAQVVSGGSVFLPSVAWADREYGLVYIESGSLRFVRLYADGTPAAPAVTLATGVGAYTTGIVWNGSGYAVTYTSSSPLQVYFLRIDRNGTALSGPTRVSWVGGTPLANSSHSTIAWSGTGYLVAWQDRRTADYDVYMTMLDVNGNVTFHDLSFPFGGDQVQVTAAWSTAGQRYVLAWTDFRSGTRDEIGTGYASQSGSVTTNGIQVTGTGNSFQPTLAETGSVVGLAWNETRDGNNEIYFSVLSNTGSKIGADVRVTNEANLSTTPMLLWTGNEFGLFFADTRGTGGIYQDVYYQRLNSSGALVGSNVQLTGWANSGAPRAAFGTHGYMLTYDPGGPAFAVAVGCTTPTAPSCPEAPDAYSITGTTATVAWLPSVDRNFDIAYYEVFRNDTLVGTTSANFYNDTGLSPGTTYQYNFRAMNAADLESFGCTGAQIYVKSSAALSLGVSQSNGDINLSWNSDGSNLYRVMRGTSPQVMTQIQSTTNTSTTDFNAAQGSVCYFYSIDEPPPTSP